MKNNYNNKMIHPFIILGVVIIGVLVFLLIKYRKQIFHISDFDAGVPNILRGLKNPKDFYVEFKDVNGSKQCNLNEGYGVPSYVIILRHCDRRFKVENGCKLPAGCQGSGAEGSTSSCETNDCNTNGLMRSWSVAKWLNCFANSKGLPIAAIVGQKFIPGESNRRPTTTASLILESLNYHGLNPCYIMIGKEDTDNVKNIIFKSSFQNKIVVIVTDHGMINNLHEAIIGKRSEGWADDCFDGVSVIDIKQRDITRYKMHTLDDNDPCADCGTEAHHYPGCTYHEYGTVNPGENW